MSPTSNFIVRLRLGSANKPNTFVPVSFYMTVWHICTHKPGSSVNTTFFSAVHTSQVQRLWLQWWHWSNFTHMLYVCLYSALHRKMSYAKLHGACSCSILLSWHILTPLTTGLPCTIFYPTVFDFLNANIFYRHKGKTFSFLVAHIFLYDRIFYSAAAVCLIYVYMRRIKCTLDLIKYEGKTVQGCSHGA